MIPVSHSRPTENPIVLTPTKQPSILCVGSEWFPLKPGGLSRYAYELIHELLAHDHHVEFCGVDLADLPSNPKLGFTQIAAGEQSLLKKLITGRRIAKQIDWQNVDVVNLHFALYSLPLLYRIPAHIPITFHFHGPWALESQWEGGGKLSTQFKKWMEQRVYQRCDRFITLSQSFANILHQDYGVPYHKIHIIPGGINTSTFQMNLSRQQARQHMGFPSDRPILFTPRRLIQRVGIDKLLEALVQVKQQVPNVLLVIAGKGAQRQALEQQVQRLELQQNVQFLGYVPDEQLPICYQAADLTVVPSQSLEGFGLILLESLACGTPVLSTPVGGMPEVLMPFDPNLITAGSDARSLGDRLIALLTGQLNLPDRQACRHYAITNYDWKQIAAQVRDVVLLPKNVSTQA